MARTHNKYEDKGHDDDESGKYEKTWEKVKRAVRLHFIIDKVAMSYKNYPQVEKWQ